MESLWTNETYKNALVDSSIVGLILFRAVIYASILVKQEVVNATFTFFDISIASLAWLLTLFANIINRSLVWLIEAGLSTSGVCVENKVLFACCTGVYIFNTSCAIFITGLTLASKKDLSILLASIQALFVERIKSHVAVASRAFTWFVLTGFAGG